MSYSSSNRINGVNSWNDSPKDVRFLNLSTSPPTLSSSSPTSSSPSLQSYSSQQKKSNHLDKFTSPSSQSRNSPRSHVPRYDNFINNGRGSTTTTYADEMKTPPPTKTWSLSAPRPEFSSDYDNTEELVGGRKKNHYMAGVATRGIYADIVTRIGYQPCITEEGFWVRYCILADFNYRKGNHHYYDIDDIEDPMVSKKEILASDLRRLLSTISRDLWLVSNQDKKRSHTPRKSTLDDSNYTDDDDDDDEDIDQPFDLPKYLKTGSRKQQYNKESTLRSSAVLAPPMSLFAPDELHYHSGYKEERLVTINPDTVEEFLALDFASRCALAGLQLGRSKIFIRRDTFDQLESMLAEKIRKSATNIQTFVRCCLRIHEYNRLYRSTIRVQSVGRMYIAIKKADVIREKVVRIQRYWRTLLALKSAIMMKNLSATKIQRAYRRSKLSSSASTTPAVHINTIVRMQAIIRGYITRSRLVRKQKNKPEQIVSVSKSLEVPNSFQRSESSQFSPQIRLVETQQSGTTSLPSGPSVGTNLVIENDALLNDLFREIENENWAIVDIILDKYPELARIVDVRTGEVVLHKLARHTGVWPELLKVVLVLNPLALMHRDNMGALPMHHAAAFDSFVELQMLYEAYNDAISSCDKMGRLPIHVAAMYDAVDSVKFLLSKYPEAAHEKIHRPASNTGGGLALHVACANSASIGVITALVAANVASTKKPDENGDLPLHLLLRCGETTDPAVVKNLLTCFPGVLSRTDSFGNLPLAIAIKSQCPYVVVNTLLTHYPEAARILNADQQSPLVLAFQNQAEDRTIIALLNHAPELATAVDIRTGLLPIQIATEHEQSTFIVHTLLKRDLPIDLNEKVRARLIPHHFSWNHVVSNTDDLYHQVVSQVLRACTQPQVLALAHIEGPDGRTALAAATVICKYEIRVMLRLFNTLEVMHERPAYTNAENDTQIFYALRFEPPPQQNVTFNVLHEAAKKGGADDYLEDFDDQSHVSAMSRGSIKSTLTSRTQQTVEDRLRHIRNEKGEHVIVKLTSRAALVERELKVRKDYQLSRHYIPAILSVHHTVQHAAYYDAMAESGFCITMEGADATAENQKEALMNADRRVLTKALKRIGISLLHMHEHGLVHCDFGAHNIGSFSSRWKLLSVGGSVPIGGRTDPGRGLYPPPEAINVESKRIPLGKKLGNASIVSVAADPSFDIWAYGVLVFELVVGIPLSPYANRGKCPLTQAELHRLAQWDDTILRREIGDIPEEDPAIDLLRKLLNPNPRTRFRSMRSVLDHPFFTGTKSPKRSDDGTDIEMPTPPRNQSLPTQISISTEEDHYQNANNKNNKSSTIRGGFKKLRSGLKKSGNQEQTRIYI